jgi:hypothetical protein
MNETNFEHAISALLLQMALGLLTGNWWIGAAAGAFFFLGREHAQFERKLVAGGSVLALNPFAGFQAWKWSLDSQLDLLFPVVATLAVAIAHHLGMQATFEPLFALLVVLNIADAVLTVQVLGSGGRELNPIMTWVMKRFGVVPALILVKSVALAAFYVAFAVEWRGWAYAHHLTAALCGLYGLVVCNNWRQSVGRA